MFLSIISIAGVIGNLIFKGYLDVQVHWIPASISHSMGIEEYLQGSGRPIVICE